MSITLKAIQTINTCFNSKLVDKVFLETFQNHFYYDCLYQIHFIRKLKCKSDKITFLTTISQQVNQVQNILQRPKINFAKLQNTTKITDYVHVIKQLILLDQQALNNLMNLRKSLFEKIKNNEQVNQKLSEGFFMFYEIILQGNQFKSQYTLRQVLLGIQKLLKDTKIIRKDIYERRNKLYQTNRTIKDILEYSLSLKQIYDNDQEFIESINLLLKEKKWMGPNIYKLLRKYKWKGYEIDMLVDLMEITIKQSPKFNSDKTKSLVYRTLSNIKSYSQYVKDNPNTFSTFKLISTTSDWPSFSKQYPDNGLMRQQDVFQREIGIYPARYEVNFESSQSELS